MMKSAPVVFVTVVACLISTAFCCSLEYTCRQGNYIVANPDISIYDSVNANQGGVACSAVMSGDKHLISIGSCGSSNVMVNFSGDGTVLSCTLGDCVEETGLSNGLSRALEFNLNSVKISGARSVPYLCHSFGVVLIKNPRPELYYHSKAYSMKGSEFCTTSHLLQNKVIEVYNCDIVTGAFGSVPKRRTSFRQKSTDTLSCLEILDCPNQYEKNVSLKHLTEKIDLNNWYASSQEILTLDRAIIFARMCPTKVITIEFENLSESEQNIPSWAGVRAIMQFSTEMKMTNLGYNPVIQGLPTDMNTIYTGIKIVENQTRMLGQSTPVITFDLQLYIIAQEVRLRNWEELNHIVLRMGGFHILELYWKILGKRFSFSGFEDILNEAEVFGPNAITHIMQGGNYKRCTLAHKLMFEVMCRLQFQEFLTWLQDKDDTCQQFIAKLEEKSEGLQKFLKMSMQDKDMSAENCADIENGLRDLQQMLKEKEQDFKQFITDGKKASHTFHLWTQYIEDVQNALDYIAAEKIPSWHQHLQCFADICDYAFAYDRQNYARWGPVYLAEMHLLQETAPEIYTEFQRGKHVVTRSSKSRFNSVWSDLGLEQSVVKDTKSRQGGIIGFSRIQEATLKWYLTVHERSGILRNFKAMCGLLVDEDQGHRDLKRINTKKDEIEIQKIMQVITDRFGNPFSVSGPVLEEDDQMPDPLINIATGVVAPTDVTNDLLKAKSVGQKAMKEFVGERLHLCETELSKPIKRFKLRTFANVHPTKSKQSVTKVKSINADRELFGRLVVISKDRKVDLEKFFKYELSDVPLALANDDGSLAKTNKAQTLRDLESYATTIQTVPERNLQETALFIDYMAVVQILAVKGGIRTFGHLVCEVIKFIKRGFLEGNCVHVVSDRYDYVKSIKAGERKRRGANINAPEIKVKSREQVFPSSLRAFLSNPKNKDNFNSFAFEEMLTVFKVELSEDQHLVLSGGFKEHERVVHVFSEGTEELVDLFSTHDEADTRLWLHVNYAPKMFSTETAIIWSPDTDVLVLGIHFFSVIEIQNIWFKTGTKRNMRYIPLHTIAKNLGPNLCRLILPFHAFTGCDSTSCFKWKGKKKGLELLKKDESFALMEELGNNADFPDTLTEVCTSFACRLYQPNGQERDIDKLRYKMFCKKPKQNDRIPPCKDSTLQHCRRVNYQCFIWKNTLCAKPEIPTPDGRGWTVTDDRVEPVLMTQDSAPREMAEMTTCNCKVSKCATAQCVCRKVSLSCTSACLCEADDDICDNYRNKDECASSTDDSDSEEMDSD